MKSVTANIDQSARWRKSTAVGTTSEGLKRDKARDAEGERSQELRSTRHASNDAPVRYPTAGRRGTQPGGPAGPSRQDEVNGVG